MEYGVMESGVMEYGVMECWSVGVKGSDGFCPDLHPEGV